MDVPPGAGSPSRRALVVGDGEVAETVAARLAFGGSRVARERGRAPAPRREEPHDAVVLVDGRGLAEIDLAPVDLPAWAAAALGSVHPDGIVILVGADGRLGDPAAPAGPLAVLDALDERPSPRVAAVLLREADDGPRTPASAPPGAVGAWAADAVEYLASARASALTGAVLRAPVLEAAPAARSAAEEAEALVRALGPAGLGAQGRAPDAGWGTPPSRDV